MNSINWITFLKIASKISWNDYRQGIKADRIFRKSYARYHKHGWDGMTSRLMIEYTQIKEAHFFGHYKSSTFFNTSNLQKKYLHFQLLIKQKMAKDPLMASVLKEKAERIPQVFWYAFDTKSYLIANADVQSAIEQKIFKNPREHFILYGYDEILEGRRRIGNEFPFITENDYLQNNNDIRLLVEKKELTSGYQHFLENGYQEFIDKRRNIGGSYPFGITKNLLKKLKMIFSVTKYIDANPDISDAINEGKFKNEWEHFIRCGIHEIRQGNRQIDPDVPAINECEYVFYFHDIFQELKQGNMVSPFEHFLLLGAHEIRTGLRKLPNNKKYFYFPPKFRPEIDPLSSAIFFSIIMPVYNVEPKWLEMAIESVRSQWYPNWELCIVDDASTNKDT
ncbi:MAG: glycosyltransferase, partial [Sulfuricurvum sp.]|nr:glycosyltransferase [Sulfuricurvum sp.]